MPRESGLLSAIMSWPGPTSGVEGLDSALTNAAAFSVLACLEDLGEPRARQGRGCDGAPRHLSTGTEQSFLIDNCFQRRLEASDIARVGAEIVTPKARHRTDVDSRLTGERP